MHGDDDAMLVRACREGDTTAWETLVRRYQRLIYAIPRRAGLGEDLAAEVFQAVCVALLEHLDGIQQPERLSAWLVTTARRESWRVLRRERSTTTLVDDEGQAAAAVDGAPLPEEQFERLERQLAVRRAISAIDERCRTLLTLLFYEVDPPSYAEIAARLNLPEGSIGPTRARCLQKLQRTLEKNGV
jgi:RNA polymerase sigma factor (sigma-70 family)